jgi:hypothetical protein
MAYSFLKRISYQLPASKMSGGKVSGIAVPRIGDRIRAAPRTVLGRRVIVITRKEHRCLK